MISSSSNPTQNAISPTLAINQLSRELAEAGREIFFFGFGQSPFPVPDHIVKALQAYGSQKNYLPTAGLKQLREQVANHFSKRVSISYSWENVMIGPGSKELIFLAQLSGNSTLLLPAPSWVSYAPQAKILGKEVVWLKTCPKNNYCLDAATLEEYCQANPTSKKLLILNSPNNPTGVSYYPEELKALAEVARKYSIIVISDEIYGALNFYDKHQSLATYYPEGTMITEGLSKWCGAGGWRLGLIIIPNELRSWQDRMLSVASETYSCVSAPTQYAAVEAYRESPLTDQYLVAVRAILKTIARYVAKELHEAGIICSIPEGGFYLFPDFSKYTEELHRRGIKDSKTLCQRMLTESGVALLPGIAFGRPEEEFTARLAFVDFEGALALKWCEEKETTDLDHHFLQSCCPQIIKGTQSIISWTKNNA